MKKAFVPALAVLLVLIVGVIGYILNSGPTSGRRRERSLRTAMSPPTPWA